MAAQGRQPIEQPWPWLLGGGMGLPQGPRLVRNPRASQHAGLLRFRGIAHKSKEGRWQGIRGKVRGLSSPRRGLGNTRVIKDSSLKSVLGGLEVFEQLSSKSVHGHTLQARVRRSGSPDIQYAVSPQGVSLPLWPLRGAWGKREPSPQRRDRGSSARPPESRQSVTWLQYSSAQLAWLLAPQHLKSVFGAAFPRERGASFKYK